MSKENTELIIFDNEFTYAKKEIISYGNQLTFLLNDYINAIEGVLKTAIIDKEISSNLSEIVKILKTQKPIIKGISKSIGNNCSKYIEDIDAADKFLY